LNSPCSPSTAPVITETPPSEGLPDDTVHKLEVSYRLLFERNLLPMWIYDVKTLRMLAVNDAALSQYGYSKQEFVGLTLLDLHHDDDVAQLHDYLKLPASEQAAPRVWRHKDRNGVAVEVEMVTDELEQEGVHARMALVRDVTRQRRAEQAQRELADQLTTALESITDAFFTLDRDWRFTYVNARAEQLLQCAGNELLGCSVWEKFPEWVGTICQFEWERAMAGGRAASFDKYDTPAGVWRKVHVYPSARGLAVNCREITGDRVPGQRLLEEQETLAAVVNSVTDAIITTDIDGRIKQFNPGAERIFRRTRASMLGQPIEVLLPERSRAGHAQHLRRFAESGASSRMMGLGLVRGLRSDGQEIVLESTIAQVTVHQQQVLIASMRDVSERVRADAEFQESRALLSELTQKLMTQEKTLVKRLAQALHDQLGQTMAAIRMAHETIVTLQADNNSLGIDRLQAQMGTLINQAVREVRQVLIDLRPPLLDEHGLAEALDNELRNRSLTQPQIDFSIDVQPDVSKMRWSTDVEYAAFMIAREAIENALRHSGSSSVAVCLRGTPTSLQLEVADNGVGLAPGATVRTGHLGILGMHERAQAIGASLTLKPGETGGTCVRFNWQPVPLI
jgi:PAS domain S-box-containing protein